MSKYKPSGTNIKYSNVINDRKDKEQPSIQEEKTECLKSLSNPKNKSDIEKNNLDFQNLFSEVFGHIIKKNKNKKLFCKDTYLDKHYDKYEYEQKNNINNCLIGFDKTLYDKAMKVVPINSNISPKLLHSYQKLFCNLEKKYDLFQKILIREKRESLAVLSFSFLVILFLSFFIMGQDATLREHLFTITLASLASLSLDSIIKKQCHIPSDILLSDEDLNQLSHMTKAEIIFTLAYFKYPNSVLSIDYFSAPELLDTFNIREWESFISHLNQYEKNNYSKYLYKL